MDQSPKNLVWICVIPCLGQEVGWEASQGLFLSEWFHDSYLLRGHISRLSAHEYSLWATEVSTFVWTHCNDYPRVERKIVFLYRQYEDRRKLYPHHLHLYFRYAPQVQFKIKWGACGLYINLIKIGASRRWSEHLFWIHKTMINVPLVSRLWMSLIWRYIQIQTQLFDSFHTTSSYIWTLLFWSTTGAEM